MEEAIPAIHEKVARMGRDQCRSAGSPILVA